MNALLGAGHALAVRAACNSAIASVLHRIRTSTSFLKHRSLPIEPSRNPEWCGVHGGSRTVHACSLLPRVAQDKIDHFVVLLMENHAFDNTFGW